MFAGFKITRKYTLAVYAMLVSSVMVFQHLMTDTVFGYVALGILGVHGAANILDKRAGGAG
jgi:hypothetical protein